MNRYIICFIIITICFNLTLSKIEIRINPGCDNDNTVLDGSYMTLIHGFQALQNESLTYLISNMGIPSVIVGVNKANVVPKVHVTKCADLMDGKAGSISVEPSFDYSFAYSFTNLVEYNDTGDKANVNDAKPETTEYHNFADFLWKNISSETTMNKNVEVDSMKFVTSSYAKHNSPPRSDGIFADNSSFISFQIGFPLLDGRMNYLPSLQFSNHSLVWNLTLNSLRSNYSQSRFFVEMVALSSHASAPFSTNSLKSLDDEFSPGIFRTVNWNLFNESQSTSSKGGYMQWHPVSYTTQNRYRLNATTVVEYSLQKVKDRPLTMLKHSLLQAFYGDLMFANCSATAVSEKSPTLCAMNISFGKPKDKCYKATDYMAWSFTIGYGRPQQDSISLIVLIIISVGLGLPIVIIIFGASCLFVRRRISGVRDVAGGNRPDRVLVDPVSGLNRSTDYSSTSSTTPGPGGRGGGGRNADPSIN